MRRVWYTLRQPLLMLRPPYWKYIKGWSWKVWLANLRYAVGNAIGGFDVAIARGCGKYYDVRRVKP